MSSNNLAVSVRGLSKSYNIAHNSVRPTNFREAIIDRLRSPLGNSRQDQETFWALDNVEFDIPRGGVVGIIGRNGAGKSTLLKILSRITWPTAGEIDIWGRVSSLLEVGTGFHAELTGRENIFLNGSILGMTRREIRRKFDEILDFAGIEKFLDTPVKRYSSGMYVRLAFAVAANLDPEILIVDEVLAVGDAQFQRKCLGKMKDVAAGLGRTVLLVSHNMASIATLAEKSLFLDRGRVVAYGLTEEVIDQYMAQFGPTGSLEAGLFIPEPEAGRSSVVKSLEIFSQGRRTDTIRMGDDLSLYVTLDWEGRSQGKPVVMGIGIETAGGVRIVSLASLQSGVEFESSGGEPLRIRCDAGMLPLNQGQYTIRVVVGDRSGSALEIHEGLGVLHVLPVDVFGNGLILTGNQGFFYWKSEWSLDDLSERDVASDGRVELSAQGSQ
jgi:homopolymeric O-antigen transport system ATP-binding protein